MKKTLLFLAIALIMSNLSVAQKVAYIDTEYILSKIPAYDKAQKELDVLSANWQVEVEKLYAEIDRLYKEYQSEKVLMSADMQQKRENEIIKKEKAAKKLQKKYFGREGQLYKKREELVKPIQDDVYNMVKEIATDGKFGIIFDKATGAIIYANPKYDKSDDLLKKLGFN